MIRKISLPLLVVFLSACAGPQVTRVQKLSAAADTPYDNILIVSMFDSFDIRRYFEDALVEQLSKRGVSAVASTSMMDTRTPVTRQTFLDMVATQGSDAVLVTTLANLDISAKVQDASPEATYIVRPSHYYNVWSVELTEFVGPQDVEITHALSLSTQLYSVSSHLPVWAIGSKTKLTSTYQNRGDTAFIVDEAKAIVNYLSMDGLLAP